MLPVTHLIFGFTAYVIVSCHKTENKHGGLSILVHIENGAFYLRSYRKSNISPKYKSRKNEAKKEADYL